MKSCPRCSGSGVIETPKTAIRGNALGPLPPYGREVELAVNEHRLPSLGIALFYKPEPDTEARPGPHPDTWTAAKAMNLRHPGSAMVLPLDRQVQDFRWPDIPPMLDGTQIAFWSHGCTSDEQDAICRALVEAGYAHVVALGGPDCPVLYETKR